MPAKKSKKATSQGNVVVGTVKKHKKRLWFGVLAALLIISIGTATFTVVRGQSLKAKAENWTVLLGGPYSGYLVRGCKVPAYGGYLFKTFTIRTTNTPTYRVWLHGKSSTSGEPSTSSTNWQAGWGFYYQYQTLVIGSIAKDYWGLNIYTSSGSFVMNASGYMSQINNC